MIPDSEKTVELNTLLQEFKDAYPPSQAGQWHLNAYKESRVAALENYRHIITLHSGGIDITREVLLKLLPHNDFKTNRERGAWISCAPAIKKDIVEWFENIGWTKREDWPKISLAILTLVQGAYENPENHRRLCEEFSALPYTRGLQSGIMTPILNALRPDEFLLINNKSRKAINYFMGTDYGSALNQYPDLNATGLALISSTGQLNEIASALGSRASDIFDMFTHWLYAIKKHGKAGGALEAEELQDEIALDDEEGMLAAPFSLIFNDYADAHWALDVFRDALERVGITSPDDLRFAITVTNSGRCLQIILGNWYLVGFVGMSDETLMQIALTSGSAAALGYDSYEPFTQIGDEAECRVYKKIPIADLRSRAELVSAFNDSMHFIGATLAGRRSTHRRRHAGQIAAAIFDPALREALLTGGLQIEDAADSGRAYTLADCARETGFEEKELRQWLKAIERKKQAIIYGPPGTGKTFAAQKVASLLTGTGDGLVETVQFHPAYSYEDFIEGIRPRTLPKGGLVYTLTPGRFLSFCEEASTRKSTCVLIIDEINRANLARVFGELMFLMEYRDRTIRLASGTEFSIPDNVRILGTMNTADRSIALVDHALRRRFAFLALAPNFDILRRYHAGTQYQNVEGLIATLEQLNKSIDNRNYSLGISFFLHPALEDELEDIWKTEIEPYLDEYFFDKPSLAEQYHWEAVKGKLMP